MHALIVWPEFESVTRGTAQQIKFSTKDSCDYDIMCNFVCGRYFIHHVMVKYGIEIRLGNHFIKHGGIKICLVSYFHGLKKLVLILLSNNSLQKYMLLYADISVDSSNKHRNLSNLYM